MDLYNYILLTQYPFIKNFSILFVLLTACNNIFIHLMQGNRRWRNSNGLKLAAAWRPPENASIILTSANEVMRLRYQIRNSKNSENGISENIQYQAPVPRSWTGIGTTARSNVLLMGNASAFVAQNKTTTKQLSTPAYDFTTGKIILSPRTAAPKRFTGRKGIEFKWITCGTADTAGETACYFKDYGNGIIYESNISSTTV